MRSCNASRPDPGRTLRSPSDISGNSAGDAQSAFKLTKRFTMKSAIGGWVRSVAGDVETDRILSV